MFLIQTIPCKDFDYESSKQLLPSEGEWVCPNPFQSLTEVPTGGDVKGMKMLHFKQRDLGGIWATPRSSKRNIQLSNDAVTAGTAPPALPCQSSALCSGGWCLSKHSPEKKPFSFWLIAFQVWLAQIFFVAPALEGTARGGGKGEISNVGNVPMGSGYCTDIGKTGIFWASNICSGKSSYCCYKWKLT